MLRKTPVLGTMLATALLGYAAQAATEIGTPTEFLMTLVRSEVAPSSSIVLPVDESTEVPLVVGRFSLEDGELTMSGHVEGDLASPFMLRGTAERIWGWVYFRAERLAYEYSTDERGHMIVEQVPASRVCSSCDGNSPPRTAFGPTALDAPINPIAAQATATEPHLGSYPGTDLLTLQSRPGATKVLYLNIAPILSNGAPSSATAGNGTAWTKDDIWKVWQTVASGYSAFEVNVTTSPTVFAATATKNVGVANFVAENSTAFCFQGTYGTGDNQCTIYATKPAETDAIGLGRTTMHELGHCLGMLDAGDGSGTYWNGNSTYQWYPIMANYYYATGGNAVVQWSKGEWTGANSAAKIDSLASISGFLGYRVDDITSPRALTISGTTVSADSNRGQITGASDSDDFTFTIGSSGGGVNLTIDRIEYIGGAMLDVLATLKNSSGTTMATSNPTASRVATISQSSLSSGNYTLTIQGGYEGTAANGFSAYGSIGYYGIEGTVTGSTTSTSGTGGATGTGGIASTGGATNTGGAISTGGRATGGTSSVGGSSNTGGRLTGGAANTGGKATGGASNVGGSSNTGGRLTGGTANTGGNATGGIANTGGNTNTGGKATGGTANLGGSSVGGNANTGGSSSNNATGGSNSNNATGGSNSNNATGGSNSNNATGGTTNVGVGGTSRGGGSASNTTVGGGSTTTLNGDSVGDAGGCSCSTPGTRKPSGIWLALGLLPMVMLRRRRRGYAHFRRQV